MTWSLLKDTWRTLRGWETIFWSDKTQLEHCGLNAKYHIWRKPDTAHQLANTIPKLKYGGGSIKLGDVFQQWDTSYGQGKVNPAMFRSTLDDDLVQNALVLRLRQRFINRTTTLSKEPWYQSRGFRTTLSMSPSDPARLESDWTSLENISLPT